MITTVIFDMDGTLVDSEPLSRKAWYVTTERMGVDIPTSMLESFLGRNAVSVEADLAAQLGGLEQAREAFRIHAEAFDELAPSMIKLMPFAREALVALRASGLKIGLATSTGRERAMARLALFDLQSAFDSITCGDDGFKHGKPAPDIFLLAAERLGSTPEDCAVVEDSFNGVRAGHAAGMHVFMVPDMMQPTAEVADMCEAVLPSLAELPAALDEVR